MKAGLISLVARSDNDDFYDPTMIGLLVTLLVLIIVAIFALIALYVLRRKRQSMQQLPMYNEKNASSGSSRYSSHRRVAVRPSESIIVYQEKQSLIDNSDAPPTSPVPEIRITFPEELDASGKPQSGRVVLVRVGEHSIGLEPLSEKLPPYQKDQSDRFQSLDLERIGGLTEKEVEARFS
ncbi:hypothetical protein AAFC00_005149 [Neodothiora populina]|uniref:Uncharacterized protein n=1 Tax=Neodothiora populina TaxID=2781224 RepID=A0ABR3PJY1_9PEZI